MIIITDKQLKSRAHFRIDYHLTRWRWYTEPRVELFFFLFKCKLFFLFYNFPLGRQSDQNDSSNGLLAIYICVCQIEFSTECFALSSDWGFSPDPIHLVVTARRIARERERERERRSRLIIFVPFSILLRRWGEVNAVVVRDLQLLRLIVNYLFDSLLLPTELSPAFTFFCDLLFIHLL